MYEDIEFEAGVLEQLDLNELLIRDRTATFLLRVSGHSMQDAGIFDGDHVILDRSIDPRHGDVVIAAIDNELTIKRLEIFNDRVELKADNPSYPAIKVAGLSDLRIYGVVTEGLHHLRGRNTR